MSSTLRRSPENEVGRLQAAAAPAGSVRRLGSAIGLAVITLLDLLALDDITTAGAWMVETGFVVASLPALMVLGFYTFRRSSSEAAVKSGAAHERLHPKKRLL